MTPGSVVEYMQDKEPVLGFVVGPENKGKLPIMTSTGRKDSLAVKKVLFHQSSGLPATASREEVLACLDSSEARRSSEAQAIDTAELWELLGLEAEDKEWTLPELCGFVAPATGPWEQSVVHRAILNDRYRFSKKGDTFVTRSATQVEEALQREAVEAERELQREALKVWLRQVWDKKDGTIQGAHAETLLDWKEKIRNSAIFGEDASHSQHVQRYLKDLGKDKDVAFEFMVRLGEFTRDENLEILANGTPTAFSDPVLREAKLADGRLSKVLGEADREDLTDWDCYSIDDPDTTEIDDALAWRSVEGGYQVAVHIADASALLLCEFEELEREIRYRATSVYLPDLKVRMVPEILSDESLSLKQGAVRPAFTFLVTLDFDGNVRESRLTPSKIAVRQRLDYDQADQLVASGDDYWATFGRLGELLKAQREANGAVNLPFPRMEVVLKGDQILLIPDERDSASQTIVSELMILANRTAANYLATNSLPAIYRTQKAPDPPIEKRAVWMPHHLYEARRSFSKSAMSLEPGLHSGLGLDAYVQATSPIRRYRDLVLQRQIKHHLRTGETLYSREQLEEIMTITSAPVSQAERMERNRKGYFLHKLLMNQRGKEVEAVVLSVGTDRYTLQLKDTLREVDVPQSGSGLKAPGETVKVKILSVYPRERVLKVSSPI